MNDPRPVDLSPLDPARDPAHWTALLEGTRARVDAVLAERERRDVLAVVGGWARPILAAAAVLLALLGAALASDRMEPPRIYASDVERLAALSAGLAEGHIATGAELSAALGARRFR
jgi:hypothetical protein